MRLIRAILVLMVIGVVSFDMYSSNEYEIFAQKYEATFGQKPSEKVWNLGKENGSNSSCKSSCKASCMSM